VLFHVLDDDHALADVIPVQPVTGRGTLAVGQESRVLRPVRKRDHVHLDVIGGGAESTLEDSFVT